MFKDDDGWWQRSLLQWFFNIENTFFMDFFAAAENAHSFMNFCLIFHYLHCSQYFQLFFSIGLINFVPININQRNDSLRNSNKIFDLLSFLDAMAALMMRSADKQNAVLFLYAYLCVSDEIKDKTGSKPQNCLYKYKQKCSFFSARSKYRCKMVIIAPQQSAHIFLQRKIVSCWYSFCGERKRWI